MVTDLPDNQAAWKPVEPCAYRGHGCRTYPYIGTARCVGSTEGRVSLGHVPTLFLHDRMLELVAGNAQNEGALPSIVQVNARRAVAEDLEPLLRSTLGNAKESEGLDLDPVAARRGVQTLLANPSHGLAFVAEVDGQVVGSLYVTKEWSDWHAAWYWWLQSVYVTPTHRGQGVYSALYRSVLGEAARAGDVRAVRLYVERHNDQALRAYRAHGMQETEYRVFEAHP